MKEVSVNQNGKESKKEQERNMTLLNKLIEVSLYKKGITNMKKVIFNTIYLEIEN